jgi:polysaccharide pyruvyl transferase WcaK-like protein
MRKKLARPKIAHFGAFDHDSYGDLIFPIIAEHFLPDFELIHVSPTGNPTAWPDARKSISIAEAISKTDWDGVLVGGGDIVQSGDFTTKLWNRTPLLSFGSLTSIWCGASLLAAKLNIPCVWNCPGVPLEIPNNLKSLATSAIHSVDYICLRDNASAQRINKLLMRPASVVPDTALDISSLWPAKNLPENKKGKPLILSLTPADAIYKWEEIEYLFKQLKNRKGFSGEVIILPLMGWQTSTGLIQQKLKSKYVHKITIKDRKLNLEECALEISKGFAYVGNSLHGLITAVSYSVPAVLVRPLGAESATKYAGFAEHFSPSEKYLLANNYTEAGSILDNTRLINKQNALNKLDNHWHKVRNNLLSKRIKNKSIYWNNAYKKSCHELEKLLIHGVSIEAMLNVGFSLIQKNKEISDMFQDLQAHHEKISVWAQGLDASLKDRDIKLASLRKEVDRRGAWALSLEEEVKQRDGYLETLQQQFDQRSAWALSLEEEVKQRDSHLETLQQQFDQRSVWALSLEEEVKQRDSRLEKLQHQLELFCIKNNKLDEHIKNLEIIIAELNNEVSRLEELRSVAANENKTLHLELSRIKSNVWFKILYNLRLLK